MSWVAVAVAGSAIVGGVASVRAGRESARGGDRAAQEQARQFDLIRSDTAPYRQVGTQALNQLASIYGFTPGAVPGAGGQPQVGGKVFKPSEIQALLAQGLSIDDILKLGTFQTGGKTSDILRLMQQYGLSPADIQRLQQGVLSAPPGAGTGLAGPATAPDYSAFFKSPDYEFRRGEGLRDIENSFAARGGAASGNALRALTEFSSGLAGSEFGNYFNRQAALAGIGQSAVGQSAEAGLRTASNLGNIFQNQGNARASGIQGANDAIQGGIGNFLLYDYLKKRPVAGG